ncbi:F0F1 ATP synthase subunit delta [Saccharospirillum mangrovi]|uniref:F0F1 ATP synthase subunit delta n=1 Tax=Saccharospirillum mangrovi TaxID=2161747 RepID=UPI000D3BC9B3|nr:F0F1 ATP synthase subunit delta [Saccharospirillum mangrovi]
MAELSTLARPYAKATFNAALESQALAEWSQQLATLAVISEQADVQALVTNPALSANDKAQVLKDVAGDTLGDGTRSLIDVLAENRRLSLLSEIHTQFEAMKAEHEKSADVVVTSAYSLNDSQQQTLTDKLSTKLGRQVNLSVEIDESLIGGVVIKSGDLIIDGSVRGKLTKLADAMNS